MTPNTIVFVDPVCIRSPLTSSHMSSACTSPISSGVTSHGPSGPKVGALLPFTHWPARSMLEFALRHVVADAIAGDMGKRFVLR